MLGKTRISVPVVLIALVAFAGACMVGPDHETPATSAPDALATLAASSSATAFTGDAPPAQWWTMFHDARLDRLVQDARAANLDLQAAIARLHAARAVARQAFAPLLPDLSLRGSYTYQLVAPNSFNLGSGFSPPDTPYQLWSGAGDMSYELDLWGRVRRGLEAATAEELASDEDRKTAEISLTADVAQAWFDLGEANASLEIARDAVRVRRESLDLVRATLAAGAGTELDVERAQTELETVAAQIPEAERQRAVAEHRIAILLGKPADLRIEASPDIAWRLPPAIPVGVPSGLLERRPDVRAALLRVKSANARIGAAFANYFPQLTITGNAGYVSAHIETLARPTSQQWSIGPSLHLPLFELGNTYFLVLEREARKDEAVAQYRSTVLRAFGEVADALAGIVGHAAARDRDQAAVASSERALVLADQSFRLGATAYRDVLDSQRSLLSARQALLTAQRQVLSDIVQLEKALGGGWTVEVRDAEKSE
jgi:NodT family efflux transporter outer membrane factor (OMF) lipoprotein